MEFTDDFSCSSYEEESYPDIDYDHFFDDDSEAFHANQMGHELKVEESKPDPKPVFPDNSTAFFADLSQTRQYLSKNIGINPSNCRSCPIPGIVIIPIQYFNLLRKDSRNGRKCPNVLSFPVIDNYQIAHQDFSQIIKIFSECVQIVK